MSLTIKEELRRTFERAALLREAKSITTPRQWAQAKDLMLRADAAREREALLYHQRYDTRVEIACRRLMQNAAAPTRALQPGWASPDRFNPADLLRQAQRDVLFHHEARLLRIDEAEARAMSSLVRQAKRENDLHLSLVRAFGRAVDPPDGPGGGPANHRTGPRRD